MYEWDARDYQQHSQAQLKLGLELLDKLNLNGGERVLDMGCGKALSSIFLAKEFGVQVWANDLWVTAADNWERIKEMGMEKQVFPSTSLSRFINTASFLMESAAATMFRASNLSILLCFSMISRMRKRSLPFFQGFCLKVGNQRINNVFQVAV